MRRKVLFIGSALFASSIGLGSGAIALPTPGSLAPTMAAHHVADLGDRTFNHRRHAKRYGGSRSRDWHPWGPRYCNRFGRRWAGLDRYAGPPPRPSLDYRQAPARPVSVVAGGGSSFPVADYAARRTSSSHVSVHSCGGDFAAHLVPLRRPSECVRVRLNCPDLSV
jgi:hypothetical protein